MKARFIKPFKLDTPSGPMTINVGDEWNLTRTTDGSAVIVMGHGIQQKVPKEYFELVGRKVRESKTMKLTKARLKQIIKEELEAVLDGDGDLMDELFPGEEDSLMQEEATALTIALGTALGILAYKSVGPLARMARNILAAGGRKVAEKAENKLLQLEADIGGPMMRQAVEIIESDTELPGLVTEYHDLVRKVEKATGKRGPKWAAMRKRKKEVSKELSAHIQSLLTKIRTARDPGDVEKMRQFGRARNRSSALDSFDRDLPRHMRRKR